MNRVRTWGDIASACAECLEGMLLAHNGLRFGYRGCLRIMYLHMDTDCAYVNTYIYICMHLCIWRYALMPMYVNAWKDGYM